ncbi:hypothetical protein ACFLZH_02765 [Patescibacteria group bacterium]
MSEFGDRPTRDELVLREQQQQDARRSREVDEVAGLIDEDHLALTIDLELTRRAFINALDLGASVEIIDQEILVRRFMDELANENLPINEVFEALLAEVVEELLDEGLLDEDEEPAQVWGRFEELLQNKVVVREE